MVLALLALSATLLVSVSRAALRAAVTARAAEEDLQQRWGAASCRRAVLSRAEPILGALERERGRPTPTFTFSVRLGRQSFDLTLADEQAKANVNALLENSDAARAENRIRQGLSGSGLSNRIKLRPTVGPIVTRLSDPGAPPPTTRPAFSDTALSVGGWGQVFDGLAPAQLIRPAPGGRVAPVDALTCWGNGAVNVRRAGDAALNLAAGRSLTTGEIGRLIDARDKLFEQRPSSLTSDESPAAALKDLMAKAAGQSLKNQGNLALTETSTCHSLWVTSRTGLRERYDLYVSDESDPKRPMTWSFSW